MTLDATEQHHRFIKRLDASRPSTFRVAEWFHKKGWSISIPAIRFKPMGANPMDYVDDGDLFINKADGEIYRIDVKHSSVDFTDAGSWPTKYKGKMIVSNKAAVDRADGDSLAYIIVSKSMNHMAIIRKITRPNWIADELYATNTQQKEWFYLCPIIYADFRSFADD
jgi:hypothetical protein